ncbi:rhodanese-like domain-containing protein [Hwangdonia seohaensis]|uniref:Rhodanese-like domain-containing protein n=1 Tax=Hwangdonia seohaensis TaxID=1240727 RepID=A0ABW3R710_9FLAO|nr:rhodanese-like domain-containing protein [Hwangdonia seohaensis]
MAKKIAYIIIFLISTLSFSQKSIAEILKKYNTESIPYITVNDASKQLNAVILDAREFSEYKTSRLKNAIYVGYNDFNLKKTIKKLNNKQQPVIVYCSIGVRSEDIAEKLKKAGYTSIYNLYGGIFEWKNNNLPVYNSEEKETDSIHTFNKEWSKWLKKGIKIYD